MPEVMLPGCTPEPLMNYLKALGVLRLVSEQADPKVRGWWWKDDVFCLRSTFDSGALVNFFLREYKPTPIVVPWSGNDFFGVNWQSDRLNSAKTPTGSRVIEAILATSTDRFERYRAALRACKLALEEVGIDSKDEMGKKKWEFIERLRSVCAEPSLLDWIDCAAVLTAEKFAPLLGSGGGSDGNTHFSDNFMQNLWDVLPDFDEQRKTKPGQAESPVIETSRRQLDNALFGTPTNDQILKRTSSLYDSGAVGGPNATQGMERESLSNPWDIVLALEGSVSFAAAAVKRLLANARVEAAFPFQMRVSITQAGLADKEQAGAEIWLPLWDRTASSGEVHALLREGRAEYGGRRAKSGLDMARAVATLGIDRGVGAFRRYAIVKGRVGGENYNTAASLGRFPVVERPAVDLLRELDCWLDSFRRACGDGKAPQRFKVAMRAIDESIFGFCRYGGPRFFQAILVALGRAERELALSEGRITQERSCTPIRFLSPDWVDAANDGAPEFEIPLALAGIHHPERKIGPLRANLEPITSRPGKDGKRVVKWAERDRAVVWNSASLPANLAHVLARRMMDGGKAGCDSLPLAASNFVSLGTISQFLAGELDDGRIEDLLWGLMLVEQNRGTGAQQPADVNVPPLPRTYALLKLLFLPEPLQVGDQRITITPESQILTLLAAGRIGKACEIAMRRLRASGLAPLPHPRSGGTARDGDWEELDHLNVDGHRLGAALLLPINRKSIGKLCRLILRKVETEAQIA